MIKSRCCTARVVDGTCVQCGRWQQKVEVRYRCPVCCKVFQLERLQAQCAKAHKQTAVR